MTKKNKEKSKKILSVTRIVFIVITVVLMIGISYSIFSLVKLSDKTNTVTVGDIVLTLTDGENVDINNAMPMVMSDVKESDSKYNFSISNGSKFPLNYNIYLQNADFDNNDKCRTVTFKNQDESTTGDVNCTDNLRLSNSVVAAKILKKDSSNSDYKVLNTNGVSFVGQLDNTDGKSIQNYTLLSTLKNEDKGLLLDSGIIDKGGSDISYSLLLFIPYPVEYNNTNKDLSVTTASKNDDGYTIYTTNKFKSKIIIEAVQTTK